MKQIRQKILVFALLIGVSGFLASRWQQSYDLKQYAAALDRQNTFNQGNTQANAVLIIDNTQDTPAVIKGTVTANETLFDLTKQLITANNLKFDYKDYGDMGFLVTQIGDKINGQDSKYWQYWVNNEQVQTAANKYQVKSGDVILWRFAESKL